MKKKNLLKDLIYIQENKSCTRQTIKGLFRAILEPVLENNLDESVVIFNLKAQADYSSLLKRLEFTSAKMFDLSQNPHIQAQEVEFIYVLSRRYGAMVIFDFDQELAQYYLLHNSKTLTDILQTLQEIAEEDFNYFIENFKPDRRENELMNLSIRKIVAMLDETNQEVLISEKEKEKIQEGIRADRLGHVSHEIRNQLSICDLYANIIKKKLEKLGIQDCTKDVEAIQKSLKLANASIWDLKSLEEPKMDTHKLKVLVENAVDLSKVYIQDKDIKITTNFESESQILADESKFLSALINLLKNAIEAIDKKGKISINIDEKDDEIFITIANNGSVLEKEFHEKIFDTGFSTKDKGRGFGLVACKKAIEAQNGVLNFVKSDEISTVFEIKMPRG